MNPPGDPPSRLRARACSAPVRVLAASLQALAALNLFYIAAHILYDIVEGVESAPPFVVAVGLVVFSGVPWAAVALLRRLLAATVDIQPPLLVLALRQTCFEIPLASIRALRPWRLPLPGPGLALEMTSGRRFRYRLQLDDPGAFLSALGAELPAAQSALGHASVAHARAKHLLARRRWVYWLVKFGLFPLGLTIIAFRLHQIIVYGGPFGQVRLLGLAAYLKTFGEFWVGTAGGLVVYAGLCRLLAEALALLLTWALPSSAPLVRRLVEGFVALAYFVAVPAYVLFLLLR